MKLLRLHKMNPAMVQQAPDALLQHGDIKMVLRYSHLGPQHKSYSVERLVAR